MPPATCFICTPPSTSWTPCSPVRAAPPLPSPASNFSPPAPPSISAAGPTRIFLHIRDALSLLGRMKNGDKVDVFSVNLVDDHIGRVANRDFALPSDTAWPPDIIAREPMRGAREYAPASHP